MTDASLHADLGQVETAMRAAVCAGQRSTAQFALRAVDVLNSHFPGDKTAWRAWCRAIGAPDPLPSRYVRAVSVLSDSGGGIQACPELSALSLDSLCALSKLPKDSLARFLEEVDVSRMGRTRIEKRVAAWLTPEKVSLTALAIDHLAHMSDEQMRSAVRQLRPETIRAAIDGLRRMTRRA